MTPVECMKLQLDRDFSCTLGCGELESIARKVLLDLCLLNKWDSWLKRSDYTGSPTDEDSSNNWSHGHWAGATAYECSFSRFIEYHPTNNNWFRVNQQFIDAMHFAENV